jgi:hypothetical protein
VPKNITSEKFEVWCHRWIFKNEFFNNFPTNRNSAQIADINNKNQVSALSYFADIVNLSAFSIANKFRIYENC